jgi:hypothetical protein
MTLLYSISGAADDQREEAAEFLSTRWADVLEEEPVLELRNALSSSSWTAESFDVLDVQVEDQVRAKFTFEAKGLDRKSKASGDRIRGTAIAVVDEYDRLKFIEIEVG